MNCKICNQNNQSIFSGNILNKHSIEYYHCSNCGFLQTEEPYWMEEAYDESINISDTGIISRNLGLSQISTIIINIYFNKNGFFLDFAGGYGVFTRLMRDIGFNFYWNDKFSPNLVARGFEYKEEHNIELLTTFESFEHFDQPIKEVENMLQVSKNILFSTELFTNEPPLPEEWGYYGLGHGQHISFYTIQTLEYIASKYGLNLYSDGEYVHLLTEKKINNFLFKVLIKLNRFGLFYIVKRLNTSRTMQDWELLK